MYENKLKFSDEESCTLYTEVEQFLIDRNTLEPQEFKRDSNLDLNNRVISKSYVAGKLNFEIHFQSEDLVNYIHP